MVDYTTLLQPLILFALVSAIMLRVSYITGFWRLPAIPASPQLPFISILVVFALYLGVTILLAPIGASFLSHLYFHWAKLPPPQTAFGYLQAFFLILLFVLIYHYSRYLKPHLFKAIWKRSQSLIITDIGMGALAWIISFPLMNFVSQGIEILLYRFTSFTGYEQVAITYLKGAKESPALLGTALFTILIAAPCIEELLFRGYLQTYLKQLLPTKGAIILSSLCFALFHFSTLQGLGNLSLCASLFVLALFLGFLYERQGSLFANVSLHMTFNTISCARVLFFE